MSKSYLYGLSTDEANLATSQTRITLHPFSLTSLQVDDRIFPVRISTKRSVLPAAFKIVSMNRNTRAITAQLEERYNHIPLRVPIESLEGVNLGKFVGLQEALATKLITSMGGKRMEEKALLDYIRQYTLARGYYFDEETLCNYHTCLKTRPFVILAGLSGTGKSKLSQLYAEALGAKYLRLAVRPNWNDDRYLLGYLNTITSKYMTEPALDFVLDANTNEDDLHFFCLDEMNLAHVEYYFSQFLSAMEEERLQDRRIALISPRSRQHLDDPDKAMDVPDSVLIPINLLFTGTINVDETTHPISDKVIDRANTLEFFAVDLDKIPENAPMPDPVSLSAMTWQSYRASKPDTSYRAQILAISKILKKADLGLGYRVLREIEMYLANSNGLLDPLVAFDLQFKQRILPRVRGTHVISSMLEDLLTFTKLNKLPRSQQRIEEMQHRLKRDGYTSFWR